jgi:F0F1-type ATP synthase assembly protein I
MTDNRETGRRTPNDEGRASIQSASSEALGHGITIAVAIGMFLWLGDLADQALGTSPVFAFLGMFLGAGAGFYRLYVHMVVLARRDDDEVTGEDEGPT